MQEAINTVAKMMALAARTAPKAVGKDYLEIRIIEGEIAIGVPLSATGKSIFFDR